MEKFSLTAEELAEVARLTALHKCKVQAVAVPLDEDGNSFKTVFVKEADIEVLDAYMAMERNSPLIARKNLFGACLCMDQADKEALLSNRAVVLGVAHVVDMLTMSAVAMVKKSSVKAV